MPSPRQTRSPRGSKNSDRAAGRRARRAQRPRRQTLSQNSGKACTAMGHGMQIHGFGLFHSSVGKKILMSVRIDLSGKSFGRWKVVSYAGNRHWHCQCKCGCMYLVYGGSLRGGKTNGCIKCHPAIGNRRKHGKSGTRLYNIWCAMKARCGNASNAAFPRYGGRGILVCSQWENNFEAFRDWALTNGYRDSLTIDRVNNDKGYEPSNCRWSTYAEQNRNYSRNRYVEHQGRRALIGDFAAERGLPNDVVKNRVFRYGWTIEKALSTPVHQKCEAWREHGMSRSAYYRAKKKGVT